MKKVFVLFTFISLTSFVVNAQTCPHAKTGVTAVSQEGENFAKTVAAAAAMDENIKQEVCSKSGHVSYSRKVVNEGADKVSYAAVEYDAETKKFVNVSPSAKADKKASCAASCAKTCTKSSSSSSSSSATKEDAKVKKVSNKNY